MTDDSAAGEMLHHILSPALEPGPPYTHTFAPHEPDPAEAVAWLRQQIEADKATADAAVRGALQAYRWLYKDGMVACSHGRTAHAIAERVAVEDGVHIALHDPWDVIADGEAKLAILDEHRGSMECDCGDTAPCPTVRLLASACQHREGYATYWGTPPTHTITQG